MVLYWIIFFVFVLGAIYDWRKTVIAWIPLCMLFNQGVCLKYSSPAISLVLAVDFFLFFYYLIFVRRKRAFNVRVKQTNYFFKHAFLLYLFSYFLSAVFTIAPYTKALTVSVKFFVESFGIIYVFQLALRTKDDILWFFRVLFITLVPITIVGITESVLKINPILTYIYLNAPSPELIDGKMFFNPIDLENNFDLRFGMRRAFSFFGIHIDYGCACVMWYFLILYVLKRYKLYRNTYFYIFIPLCLSGVILCNSKTPMIGLLLFTLPFFNIKSLLNFKLIIVVLLICTSILFYIPEYINNLFALFDTKLAEESGGSNANMRLRQYEVGLKLFMQNPIVGNGIGSGDIYMNSYSNSDLLGSESSWLKILPTQGLIGAIAYLFLYYLTFIKLKKVTGCKISVCFVGGLFLMEFATGFMDFYIWAAIIIVIYRMYLIFEKNVCE